MDMPLKVLKSCTLRDTIAVVVEDRLSSLPDEVLIQILSLLPTKYAAATCALSRRLNRVFPWIMSLDFDDSPVSHCLSHPYETERFPTFVSFVNFVLGENKSQCLTRFRLRVGSDFITRYLLRESCLGCWSSACLPDLKNTQINSWIWFPLTHSGLRELDLCIHIREQGVGHLPTELFICETLEVLKLDVNLSFDRVSTFCLPRLKSLQLHASLIGDDSFITKLVSSCPVLEDLTVKAWSTNHVHFTNISSTSLRRMYLRVYKDADHTEHVLIHTPNLEHLFYVDNLAVQYSISDMYSLVKAVIVIDEDFDDKDTNFQQMLKLIRPVKNVEHLVLNGMCLADLSSIEILDELPTFNNLKHLELGYDINYWDKVLLSFLNHLPILETLVFPLGMSTGYEHHLSSHVFELLDLEKEFCKTTQAIPLCCRSHLKNIVIKYYKGVEREVNLIQFLLRHALVLEELVVFRCKAYMCNGPFRVDRKTLESTLRNLPRASVTCNIQVQ